MSPPVYKSVHYRVDRHRIRSQLNNADVWKTASVGSSGLKMCAVKCITVAYPPGCLGLRIKLRPTALYKCDYEPPSLLLLSLKGRLKVATYSITERRVPELIPVLGSQPAGDASHKPGGAITFRQACSYLRNH